MDKSKTGQRGKAKKRYFRDQATADYSEAHKLAYSHGMQLRQCNSAHYQLKGKGGWLLNIWPGTQKYKADAGHASPPVFQVDGEWTLVDLVLAASGKKAGVAAKVPAVANPVMFPCVFLWVTEDDKLHVVWEKEFSVPFMPEKGDTFIVNGDCSITVESSCYFLDDGKFFVYIDGDLATGSPESDREVLESYGWRADCTSDD